MNFNFETLDKASFPRGARALVVVDFNVPIVGGMVADAYRIVRARRTLDFLRECGVQTLLVSHRSEVLETLRPVFKYLRKELPLVFAETLAETRMLLAEAPDGSFVLLENIRRFSGEIENSKTFARELASLADVYVNEAFSASHRAHASIVGVPKLLPHYAGFLFEEEVRNLSKAFSPAHPFLCILGGAKFETKLPLIKKFLAVADTIYMGGALANDIYKARGYEVGASRVSALALDAEFFANPKIQVPVDVVASGTEKLAEQVEKYEKIVDAGPIALDDLRALIEKAKFVLWNGPFGVCEEGFDTGTIAAAQALAECDAETIIGGGDTLAVVSRLGLLERFSFVSTGGGAMLEFLANGTLPGIDALLLAVDFSEPCGYSGAGLKGRNENNEKRKVSVKSKRN